MMDCTWQVDLLNQHPDMRMSFVEAQSRDQLKACTAALKRRVSASSSTDDSKDTPE